MPTERALMLPCARVSLAALHALRLDDVSLCGVYPRMIRTVPSQQHWCKKMPRCERSTSECGIRTDMSRTSAELAQATHQHAFRARVRG